MESIEKHLNDALPHFWSRDWDRHHRSLHFQTVDCRSLTILTDFSAVYDNDPNDRLNCAIPDHSLQCVLVVSHSARSVHIGNLVQQVLTNDAWSFWASAKGDLQANSFFHATCVRHVIEYYRDQMKLPFERIYCFTDGCAEQYKSRRNAYFVSTAAKEFNVKLFMHVFAPTSCFKVSRFDKK